MYCFDKRNKGHEEEDEEEGSNNLSTTSINHIIGFVCAKLLEADLNR